MPINILLKSFPDAPCTEASREHESLCCSCVPGTGFLCPVSYIWWELLLWGEHSSHCPQQWHSLNRFSYLKTWLFGHPILACKLNTCSLSLPSLVAFIFILGIHQCLSPCPFSPLSPILIPTVYGGIMQVSWMGNKNPEFSKGFLSFPLVSLPSFWTLLSGKEFAEPGWKKENYVEMQMVPM